MLTPAGGVLAMMLPVPLAIGVWVGLIRSRSAGRTTTTRDAGPAIVTVMACGVIACAVLAVWAARYYPQPADSRDHRYALLCPLLAVLLGTYLAIVLGLPQRLPGGRRAAHCGLVAAVLMGAVWTVGFLLHEQFGLPTTGWAWLPVLAAPLAAGALATRHNGHTGQGAIAGLWTGLFGGLAQYIVTMTTTYSSISWYARDRQTISDALVHHQLSAVWIVGDNLGGSIFLMMVIPVLGLLLGAAGTGLPRLSRDRRLRSRTSVRSIVVPIDRPHS
jgi:hypothetical protein